MRRFRITVEGIAYEVTVEELEDVQSSTSATKLPAAAGQKASRIATPASNAPVSSRPLQAKASPGDIVSPLSGTVTEVRVSAGQSVSKGTCLLTLEAMKMESEIRTHVDGTIDSIAVSVGQAVQEGEILLRITSA